MSADIVPAKSKWPKLSEDLTGERSPGLCQCCGATDELQCWMESDESDQPTETMLVLCGHCSGVLIEPHPRLYVCLPYNAPRPGAMRCCTECTLRRGLECKHPLLKTNGRSAWSLVIRGSYVRDWGFFTHEGWQRWKEYFLERGC